ncbi:MAG: c-type cytochrome domain-containing protein [Verrucomicrobiota bacterium]
MKRTPILLHAAAILAAVSITANAAVDYEEQIKPVIAAKCLECHATQQTAADPKPKAGLALDTPNAIRAGRVITPGKPDESEFYVRLILDPEDEEFMPPKKSGPPLSEREVELVKIWIEEGAPFGSGVPGIEIPKDITVETVRTMGANEPNPDVVAQLQNMGITVTPISVQYPQFLTVEFIANQSKTNDQTIQNLLAIAPNIVELDLSRTKITDEGLKTVGKLARLRKLNLNNTGIDGSGLSELKELKDLEWLNLYNTSVDDKALPLIAQNRKLKSIYLFNTQISEEGAENLRQSMSSTKIVTNVVNKATKFDLDDF